MHSGLHGCRVARVAHPERWRFGRDPNRRSIPSVSVIELHRNRRSTCAGFRTLCRRKGKARLARRGPPRCGQPGPVAVLHTTSVVGRPVPSWPSRALSSAVGWPTDERPPSDRPCAVRRRYRSPTRPHLQGCRSRCHVRLALLGWRVGRASLGLRMRSRHLSTHTVRIPKHIVLSRRTFPGKPTPP